MKIRLSLLAVFVMSSAAWGQVAAVPQLDFGKFAGTWYEIAAYPTKRDKVCVADGVVMFTPAAKGLHFDVVRSCTTKDDTPDAANLVGKRDKAGDGKLKVGSFWPLYKPYWVLAVGPDDSWAVVGDPKHKTLWVLSRKITLGAGELAAAKAKAQAEGFDVGKLVAMKQVE